MDDALDAFLRPLYQGVDGVSRLDELDRIARIARRLHQPPAVEARSFELLLRFHLLGNWLEKVGNLSRVALAVPSVTETELRRTAFSIRRLDAPVTEAERAVAAAVLIDGAGVRGMAERLARARREGMSLMDVLREALADAWIPEWLPPAARPWLERRHEARRAFCRAVLDEVALQDQGT